ncbi:uncharacterized protein GLRG_01034 [Colletotrichum graminicola M1.001]|uniref:Uncharacterized protein n=1 Tax=Colletotrichum graminicola (strain M1.001 / M2 / FGSC 10212) TaxID=645133 RepID=E3Q5C3_COLGM|nr:uncharacterized protein GLRG_01034 [Colletotrichum graminicola M1.001]EFQ25890.1 hypothetical protein GLRG_01034 [Colletotrichum graminicola M1.001]
MAYNDTEVGDRDLFLAARNRHPVNEAIVFMENRITIPGKQQPLFSENKGELVYLKEALAREEERYECLHASNASWADRNGISSVH